MIKQGVGLRKKKHRKLERGDKSSLPCDSDDVLLALPASHESPNHTVEGLSKTRPKRTDSLLAPASEIPAHCFSFAVCDHFDSSLLYVTR